MSGWVAFHLRWVCRVRRHSLQRYQKLSARLCTCFHCCLNRLLLKKVPGRGEASNFWGSDIVGLSMRGEFGSVEIGTKGLALIVTAILARNMQRTSWEREWDPCCINIPCGMCGVDWIPKYMNGHSWIFVPHSALLCSEIPIPCLHLQISFCSLNTAV